MKRTHARRRQPSKRESAREEILRAVLLEVPFDGWSKVAFRRGLEKAGFERGEADLLLPNGILDVIEQFGIEADQEMQARIAMEPGFGHRKVRDKITFALRSRLEFLTPKREAMRRLMYWYALPLHTPLGLKRLYRTVDLMWRAAGDTSTDFNFYTKRMLLAGVLKATVLFWLDDETPGCEASWAFLDRRIGEVLKIGKTISLLKEWKPAEVVEMVRAKVRRA